MASTLHPKIIEHFFQGLGYIGYCFVIADGDQEVEEQSAMLRRIYDHFRDSYSKEVEYARRAYREALRSNMPIEVAYSAAIERFAGGAKLLSEYKDFILELANEIAHSDNDLAKGEQDLFERMEADFKRVGA